MARQNTVVHIAERKTMTCNRCAFGRRCKGFFFSSLTTSCLSRMTSSSTLPHDVLLRKIYSLLIIYEAHRQMDHEVRKNELRQAVRPLTHPCRLKRKLFNREPIKILEIQ